MKQFKIEPRLLQACLPAMSTEETRYYLMGVHIFERDGKLIYEATNGHLLIRVQSSMEQEDAKGINIIVPDFFAKELSKKSFRKGYDADDLVYLDAVIDAQTLSIEMPKGIATNHLIDGTYPDTDRVIPANVSCRNLSFDTIGANLEYMARISKSIKSFASSCTASIAFTDSSGPMRFSQTLPEGQWQAILMPVRVA